MDAGYDGSFVLNRGDLAVLYPLLKSLEDRLREDEYRILMNMEKTLYRYLSIEEAAELLKKRKV